MAVIPAARLARPGWWPGVAAWALWALWALTMLGLPMTAWLDQLSRQAGRPELAQLIPGAVVGPVLGMVSATTVGAVLASRRPRHPVGWLLLACGLFMVASGVALAYAAYGLLARPGALPAAHAVARYWPATTVIAQTAISFVLLLTPHRVAALAPLALVGSADREHRGGDDATVLAKISRTAIASKRLTRPGRPTTPPPLASYRT
jgi:hypothetical protein